MEKSFFILMLSTVSVAFFHALAPDHWMPFAVIGRAQKWSNLKLLFITFISGIGHVGISVIFSVIGIALGFTLDKLHKFEGGRGSIALWLLIGFGIAYMLWGIKQAHSHKHDDIEAEKLKKQTISVWIMFAVVILGPCEPLIPLAFLGYNFGWLGIISVSIIFSVVTLIMMLVQSFLALKGIQLIKYDIAERYAHAFAGLVIALTGVLVMVLGI
ncbi:MAG: hypothetical protein Q8O13_00485 [Candidatus Omnitrophota bacterium]|nr:hypothetical protein [Candidatus Omnitrophota bacterium]